MARVAYVKKLRKGDSAGRNLAYVVRLADGLPRRGAASFGFAQDKCCGPTLADPTKMMSGNGHEDALESGASAPGTSQVMSG